MSLKWWMDGGRALIRPGVGGLRRVDATTCGILCSKVPSDHVVGTSAPAVRPWLMACRAAPVRDGDGKVPSKPWPGPHRFSPASSR